MPQIGWSELLIIAVIAILVIGPKELPIVMKKVGSWIKTIKSYANSFQTNLENISNIENIDSENYEVKKTSNKKNKIKVIEDCSQAHGAMINEKLVGSFGDISVWSFCNDKIISTLGEGGMISTGNKRYYEKLWSLKDIGKNISPRCDYQWQCRSNGNAFGTIFSVLIAVSALREAKTRPSDVRRSAQAARDSAQSVFAYRR